MASAPQGKGQHQSWRPPGLRLPQPGRRGNKRPTLTLVLVRLERYLENAVAERVAVQGLDGHHSLVVVGHGDEAEALAFVGLEVPDHLDVLHGTEWPKQLPQDVLLRLGREVINEYAPAGAVEGTAGEEGVPQQVITRSGRIPVENTIPC